MPHRLGSCFPSTPNGCSSLEPGGAPLGRVHRWSVPVRTVQCGAAGEDGLGCTRRMVVQIRCRYQVAICAAAAAFTPMDRGFFYVRAPSVSPPFANTISSSSEFGNIGAESPREAVAARN
jgi:hypothetical protein